MTNACTQELDTIDFYEVASFPSFESIDDGQLFSLSLSNKTNRLTHGLHRFPAKFIPQIPAWAFRNFAAADSVKLDPFIGSGTSLVEGVCHGGTTYGIDIDPLARFIARAKVSTVEPDRIASLATEIKSQWCRPATRIISPMTDIENFDHWFNESHWGWLQSLKDVILRLRCSIHEREFFLAVFSSILRSVSNADDQSHKTYVSATFPKKPPPVPDSYWKALNRAIGGLVDLSRHRSDGAIAQVVENADATLLPFPDCSIDVAVTSPPYLDSVDYQYNMMLEYFWLGPELGVPNRRSLNELRKTPIGAKNPLADPRASIDSVEIPDIRHLAPSRQYAAKRYFELMDIHFREMSRCLKEDARYVMVVGNSKSRARSIPVHKTLATRASKFGLHLERAFGYRIRRHYMKFPRAGRGGIILIDWVLVLKKSDVGFGRTAPTEPLIAHPPNAVAN